MPGAISDIVDVTIQRQTKVVSKRGFGIPLILGSTAWVGADIVREYSTINDVLDDFLSTDPEYLAASALFGQTPAPSTIKIGQKAAAAAQVQTIVFSADIITANTIACTIDGVALAATPFNASNPQTLTDFAATIQAVAGVTTAVSDGAHTITVTAATAGIPVIISGVLVTLGVTQATAVIATTTPNHGPAEDLTEISHVDDDWYLLINTDRTEAFVLQTAFAIESRKKLFITCSDDTDIYDAVSTADIAYILSAANYERTAVIFNETMTDYPDAAWAGRVLPEDPGSATWKFKVLSGITASNLTPTQLTALKNKECNVVTDYLNQSITQEGTVAEGEYLDIMRGTDWLQARIEENVYTLFVNEDKVPYTDAGVTQVKNMIRAPLQQAVDNGLLVSDPMPEVTAPLVANVSSTDKGNRLLPDVEFTAQYAGAIHKVEIDGVVTV